MNSLAFIGGGHMARALIGGAVGAGVPATDIHVGEPDRAQRARLHDEFGVHCTEHNAEAVDGAAVVVFAVKPQVAATAVRAVSSRIAGQALVISIMAGIRTGDLRRWLGAGPALVRCMPNTPALVGRGVTGLFAPPATPVVARDRASDLLGAVGQTVWVDDEALLDAVTGVSGSGPAYLFFVIEALHEAGVAAGLPPDTAAVLARETVCGAAQMASDGHDPAELRRQVTSPGGTTAAAVAVLEAAGLRAAFRDAVAAATARGRAMAVEFGAQ